MVSSEDVDDDLEGEIMNECSKFGQVEKVVIYQEQHGESENAEVVVKIFVKFLLSSEAEAAKRSLNARWFAGRQIRADIYDQVLFEHNDLTS